MTASRRPKMKTIAPAVHGWKLRSVMAVAHFMSLLGLGATSAKAMRMPAAKRAAIVPAPWMLLPMPQVGMERSTLAARGGPIPLKTCRPNQRNAAAAPVLFLHGGGWIAGGVDALDYLCTNLCDRLGTEVTAVGYRLAPEHPYPAALEDCEDAANALLAKSPRIDVVGDSAGGNLAAALCLKLRGRGVVRRQVLIYPALDLTMASPSIDPPRQGLSRRDLAAVVESYRGVAAATDPFISPMFAPDLSGLPPTVIVTADADPLRDDGFRYAQRLRDAGVPVRHENYAGMPHGFLSIASLCPAAPRCIDLLAGELQA